MKKLLSILSISVLLVSGSVYASFPIKNTTTTSTTEVSTSVSNSTETVEMTKSEMKKSLKEASKKNNAKGMDTEMIITLLLWLFLGGLAGHRWYKGKPTGWNILFILTGGGCGIWALVDLIHILQGKF